MSVRSFFCRFQLENIARALREAFMRFPLAVLCCFMGTALCMLAVHDVHFDGEIFARIMVFLSLGAVFFVSARLYAEGRGLAAPAEWFVMLGGGAMLAGAAFLPAHFSAMHFFLGASLVLSLIFAPYLGRKGTEDSVWFFNYASAVALAVAVVSAFIFCLGLSAIVGSMDYLLFDMSFNKKVYAHIWIFGYGFLGPVAFFRQIPQQFDYAKSECAVPGGISFIANYFVVPLILIYTWVLYAYFLKIAVNWELPKGSLAWMVTGFGSLGIAARLAVFPMRETGTVLLRQFYKYFYFLLAVPVLLLALGLYTRISQYGVTEERYAIGVCLVWLAALCGYYFARPQKAHIKHVPMVLSLLFLLGAVGPWGAVPVSTRSQAERLETLLEKAGVIGPGGQVAKTAREVSFDDRKNISSIVDYFYEANRSEAIRRFVAPFEKEVYDDGQTLANDSCRKSFVRCRAAYNRPRKLMDAWGMKYVSRWQGREDAGDEYSVKTNFVLWNDTHFIRVAPYDYFIRLYASNYRGRAHDWEMEKAYTEGGKEKLKVHFRLDAAGLLAVTRKEGEEDKARLVFDLGALFAKLHAAKVTKVQEEESEKLILRQETPGLKVEIRLADLGGRVRDGKPVLENARMIILISP